MIKMYKLYKYISLKVTNIYYVKLLIIHLKKNLISYIQKKKKCEHITEHIIR